MCNKINNNKSIKFPDFSSFLCPVGPAPPAPSNRSRTGDVEFFDGSGIALQFLGRDLEPLHEVLDGLDAVVDGLDAVRRRLNAVVDLVQLSVAARQVAPET